MNGLGPFIFIIVAAVLLALLGLVLVRRTVPYDRLAQYTDVVGYVYPVIGVIYAVILAQVVIAAWQEYQDVRTVADDEANAVLNLARLAQVWPGEDRERVEDALSAYAQHVVAVAWPDMARNRFDESLHTMTASLATLVAFLLLVEYQLEPPYRGVSAIEPTAMALVRTVIDAGLGTIGGQS